MYILLTNEMPFNGQDDKKILECVQKRKFDKKSKIFKSLSNEAKDLVKKLLTYNCDERISAEEALQHELFKKEEYIK